MVIRLGGAGALMAAAGVIALAGLGLILHGFHRLLAEQIGGPWASVAIGVVCLAFSGALLWMTRSRLPR